MDEVHEFIEVATSGMEDSPVLRDEARGELMSRLGAYGSPRRLDVAMPLAKLRSAKRLPKGLWRGLCLGAFLFILGLTALACVWVGRDVAMVILVENLRWMDMEQPTEDQDFLKSELQRRAPELPVEVPHSRALESLLERRPEDLGVLQAAVAVRPLDAESLYTDLERELIARLDPDNALWPMMEAEWWWSKALGSRDVFFGGSRSIVAAGDPAWDRGWKLFSEAVGKPLLEDRMIGLRRKIVDAFPESSGLFPMMIIHGMSQAPWGSVRDRDLIFGGYLSTDDPLAKRIAHLKNEGKTREIEILGEEYLRFARLVTASSDSVAWKGPGTISLLPKQFSLLAAALPPGDLKSTYDRLEKAAQGANGRMDLGFGRPDLSGVWLASHSIVPTDLSEDEMVPAEAVERWAFGSMGGLLMTLPLLLVSAAFGFEVVRRRPTTRGLARGLMPLFTVRDHLWVGGLGILAPAVYAWLVIGFSPLGLWDWNLALEWEGVGFVLQLIMSAELLVVMPLAVVLWRWRSTGGFLNILPPAWWLGRIAAGLLLLAIPATGIIGVSETTWDDEVTTTFFLSLGGVASVGLLWLLWLGVMNVITPGSGALGANMWCRTMLPWSMVTTFVTLLLVAGGIRIAESRWHARDGLLNPRTSARFSCGLEKRTLKAVVEESAYLEEIAGRDLQ